LSMGAGAAYVSPKDSGSSRTQGGLGGINILLGGFVNPDVAIVARIVGVNFGPFDSNLDHGIAGVLGPAVEYWLNDHFNIIGGLGVGAIDVQQKLASKQNEAGFGLMAGFNYFPLALAHHGLGLYVDVAPIFTSNFFILTYQGEFAWQYY